VKHSLASHKEVTGALLVLGYERRFTEEQIIGILKEQEAGRWACGRR
jgi:hypothetical protein